jgi:hypothetical protein
LCTSCAARCPDSDPTLALWPSASIFLDPKEQAIGLGLEMRKAVFKKIQCSSALGLLNIDLEEVKKVQSEVIRSFVTDACYEEAFVEEVINMAKGGSNTTVSSHNFVVVQYDCRFH